MTPMTSSPSTTSPASASTRSYGSDPAQVYDVIPPASGTPAARGTVVVVHGGFWRAQYDREHALPEARAFAAAGNHVVLAEYRRVGMPGGGVPGTLDDVRDLVASVASQPDLPKPLVSDATRDFVGSGPGTAAWTSADPMSTLPPKVPVRLVNGADDDTVPLGVADDYVAKAKAAGGDVTEQVVPGADHFAVIDPTTPAFKAVQAAVAALLPPG